MLNGHELTTPIQYGYLILAGILILMACIAGIIYIIRDIRATATTEPDYLGYWKKLHDLQKAPIKPHSLRGASIRWVIEDEVKDLMDKQDVKVHPNILPHHPPDAVGHYYPDDNDRAVLLPTLNYGSGGIIYGKHMPWVVINPPFHWETFLDDLIKDSCTPGQIERAKLLSAHFQTCPCGQLDPAIPRIEDGEPGQPEDEELCRLGAKFWQALVMDEYLRARDIYQQIKVREKYLLNSPSFRFIRGLSGSEGSGSEG